jgi:hypothetical protein
MTKCEESIKKYLKIMHTNLVYSNILYLLGGIYAIIKKQYLLGPLLILMSIISTMYHSNYNLIFSHSMWTKIDMFSVVIIMVISTLMIINYQWKSYRTTKKLYIPHIALLIIISMGFLYFALSLKTDGEYPDEVGVIGPLLSSSEIDDDICKKNMDIALRSFYHTIWHLITGIVCFMFVATIPPTNFFECLLENEKNQIK